MDAIACLEREKTARRSGDVITNMVRMNTIVAGADPVAVDHVCTRLMGLNPDDIEHITLAERVGLGTNNPDLIEVTGSTIEETQQRFIKSPAEEGRYGQSNRIWLIKGPYSIDGISNPIDNAFIDNEAEQAPAERLSGWSEPVYFINDHIDLEDFFATTDDIMGYAFTYFDAPIDQTAELWIGSDEAMKIYLNGEVVYSFDGTRSFNGYFTNRVSVQIKSGENRLLVKTLQKYGDYTFTLNICEPELDSRYDGNRVWDLKFKTESATTSIQNTQTHRPVKNFVLADNYPNPFNGVTQIAYEIHHQGMVNLSIYNMNGQLVSCLVDKQQEAGKYEIGWDGRSQENNYVASGIYFYRLRMGKNQIIK
ncbi:MAG: T9SS type A sorting domain-containing protein, partial [Calditrichaceae bacterium]